MYEKLQGITKELALCNDMHLIPFEDWKEPIEKYWDLAYLETQASQLPEKCWEDFVDGEEAVQKALMVKHNVYGLHAYLTLVFDDIIDLCF